MVRLHSDLQCVAVCCSVLQCAAVCCSVLLGSNGARALAFAASKF